MAEGADGRDAEPTLRFASKARRKGFTPMDNPVLASKRLSPPAKVLWGLLCMHAWRDGECYPGQKVLSEELPCGETALRGYMTELTEVGLVEVVRRGQGKTNVYVLHDIDNLGTSESADQDARDAVPGTADTEGLEQQSLAIPVEKKTQGKKTQGKKKTPTTVDRARVTAEEGHKAEAILRHWNEVFGQRLTATGYLEKIIRRCREHPEYDTGAHYELIVAIKGGQKWWRGTPDPTIIYGSDEQFERCLNQKHGGIPVDTSVRPVQSGVVDERDWNAGVIEED